MNKDKHTSIFHKIITSQYFGWIRSACLLLVLVFMFTYVSFAWLRREWTPYVYEDGITISTSGSLAFKLIDSDSSTATTGMSINKILKLGEDFVLKPVSNVSGRSEDFFVRNADEGVGNEKYQHLNVQDYVQLTNDTVSSKTYSQMGIENGYIEFQLSLIAPDDEENLDRYIYIHNDSSIVISANTPDKVAVLDCVRVSITIQAGTVEGVSGKTFIFAPDGVQSHSGVNNEYDPMADSNQYHRRYMDGVDYYSSYIDENNYKVNDKIEVNGKEKDIVIDSSQAANGTVYFHHFKDLNGGTYGEVDGDMTLVTKDTNKTLFSMNSSITENPTITVRIWVEGTHPSCSDDISDAQIDLKLQFSSFTAERQQNG